MTRTVPSEVEVPNPGSSPLLSPGYSYTTVESATVEVEAAVVDLALGKLDSAERRQRPGQEGQG